MAAHVWELIYSSYSSFFFFFGRATWWKRCTEATVWFTAQLNSVHTLGSILPTGGKSITGWQPSGEVFFWYGTTQKWLNLLTFLAISSWVTYVMKLVTPRAGRHVEHCPTETEAEAVSWVRFWNVLPAGSTGGKRSVMSAFRCDGGETVERFFFKRRPSSRWGTKNFHLFYPQ